MTATYQDTLQQAANCLLIAARRRLQREMNLCRPSVILEPDLAEAECQAGGGAYYVAEYRGLVAVGDTPDEAYAAFDQLWQRGEEVLDAVAV